MGRYGLTGSAKVTTGRNENELRDGCSTYVRSFPLVGSSCYAVKVNRVIIRWELRVLVEFIGR